MATLAGASLNDTERRGLDLLVELVQEALGERLHGIWLFGSRARGEEPGPESDVDVLVIASGDEMELRETVSKARLKAVEATDYAAYYSVQTWTPEWLENRREIKSFFVQEVDRDKIVLAGKP
jgi:predicted nucleotidyltransferase